MLTRGADSSPDYYALTYRDPTGETAVKNMTGDIVQMTWENGNRIFITIEDLTPLLASLEFRVSRKGLLWAKGKTPAATGVQNQTPTVKEGT